MKNTWFTVKRLDTSIWGIAEFGHFEKVISYLIVGKKKSLLFDTGMGIGDMRDIVTRITATPITVLNSHTHYDHVGGNFQFSSICMLKNGSGEKRSLTGYPHRELKEVVAADLFFVKPPGSFKHNLFRVHRWNYQNKMRGGQHLKIDNLDLEMVVTPGHSTDSICLYEREKGYLFSGDTLYPGPIYLQMPESNLSEYKRSIKKLLELQNIKKIFPAHNSFSMSPSLISKIYSHLIADKQKSEKVIQITKKVSILLKVS